MFINNTLRLNNLKTRTAMNAKISVFAICDEAIIYLLLYNLHDRTFMNYLKMSNTQHYHESRSAYLNHITRLRFNIFCLRYQSSKLWNDLNSNVVLRLVKLEILCFEFTL